MAHVLPLHLPLQLLLPLPHLLRVPLRGGVEVVANAPWTSLEDVTVGSAAEGGGRVELDILDQGATWDP